MQFFQWNVRKSHRKAEQGYKEGSAHQSYPIPFRTLHSNKLFVQRWLRFAEIDHQNQIYPSKFKVQQNGECLQNCSSSVTCVSVR